VRDLTLTNDSRWTRGAAIWLPHVQVDLRPTHFVWDTLRQSWRYRALGNPPNIRTCTSPCKS